MNKHLELAEKQYAEMGRSLLRELSWHMAHGRVLIMPEIFCMVRECDVDDMFNMFPEKTNALYIEYLSADDDAHHHLWDIAARMNPNYDTVCYYRGVNSKNIITTTYERLKEMLNRSRKNGR